VGVCDAQDILYSFLWVFRFSSIPCPKKGCSSFSGTAHLPLDIHYILG